MTQASPEGNFNSREDTLLKNTTDNFGDKPALTTSDVIILGEDSIPEHHVPYYREPGFIGPVDAIDEARRLHTNQAKNLAQIAVLDIVSYGKEYRKVANSVIESVSDGVLRLNADYPKMNANRQVDAFITDHMVDTYKPYDAVVAELKEERAEQRLGSKGPDRELQLELNDVKKTVSQQAYRILAVRDMLVERGASEEFMRDFYYTTKLMTKPEQEAYEHEKELAPEIEAAPLVNTEEVRLFHKFKSIVSTLSRESFKLVGIHAPQSGEVTIINQPEHTVS